MKDERGFSAIETMVASALSLVALAAILATVITAYRTQVFSQRESESLDDARTAMSQFQRDLASSDTRLDTTGDGDPICPASAVCLQVVQPGAMGARTTRFRLEGTQLKRDEWNTLLGAFKNERLLHSSLANQTQSPSVPFFSCTNGEVLVTLVVKPNPGRDETFPVKTSIQTRNNNGSCT